MLLQGNGLRWTIFGALLIGLLVAAACTGRVEIPVGSGAGGSTGVAVAPSPPQDSLAFQSTAGGARGPAASAPAAMPAKGAVSEPAGQPAQNLPPLDRMIIYTTSIDLTVTDVMQSMDQVTGLAQQAGGFVVSTNIRQEGEYNFATLTMRVPASNRPSTFASRRAYLARASTGRGTGCIFYPRGVA